MTLIDEIRLDFAALGNGMLMLGSLPNDYPGYVIRDEGGYGVAIDFPKDDIVSEHFANARLYTCERIINFQSRKFLVLQSYREDLRLEFASLCAQFLDPGENGDVRNSLVDSPLSWWGNWKELLGNAINDSSVYSVIAEMIALEYMIQKDPSSVWSKSGSATHDIESDSESAEVKSTISKYEAHMIVSSQFQLNATKPLNIYFVRMEPSPSGLSINDMVARLVSIGYQPEKLEQMLYNRGYERGASARDIRYDILEKRKYEVDDAFPKIIDTSFKGDKFPDGITHITYTIDLDAIPHLPW